MEKIYIYVLGLIVYKIHIQSQKLNNYHIYYVNVYDVQTHSTPLRILYIIFISYIYNKKCRKK